SGAFPFQPAAHSQYNTQKPKVSVRGQTLDPKYIGTLTLRGSYTEPFHAPHLSEICPASTEGVADFVFDPVLNDFYFTGTRFIGNPNLQPEVAYEWSYGLVYSPKWIKGLTLIADWWHIDMRSIASLLGTQFTIDLNNPDLVIRGPPEIPGQPGPIILVIDPNENLTGAIFEGLDYEAIYILDSSIFGHGDFGNLTSNPFTWEFSKPQTPRSGFRSWRARKVREWTTLDLILNYTFNLPPPAAAEVPGFAKDGGKNVEMKDGKEKNVMPVSTAEYNPCGWRGWLNNTTITLGMQNVFDEDPPFVALNGEDVTGYDESLATIKGRFWYVQLKKRF